MVKLELTVKNVWEFIQKRGHVSLAEIALNFMGTKGKWGIDLKHNKSIALWRGASEKFCDVFDAIDHDTRVGISVTIPLTYIADGMGLTMPVAADVNRKYKSPRWLPITLDITDKQARFDDGDWNESLKGLIRDAI